MSTIDELGEWIGITDMMPDICRGSWLMDLFDTSCGQLWMSIMMPSRLRRHILEHEFPGDTGERYLRIYGVMQALFIRL
jgi:hypothetical protein